MSQYRVDDACSAQLSNAADIFIKHCFKTNIICCVRELSSAGIVNSYLWCAEKTNTVLETMAFLTYYGSRGATFWVISKNTEVTLTKFCIGHQMRGLFIIFWNDPKSCTPNMAAYWQLKIQWTLMFLNSLSQASKKESLESSLHPCE